MPLQGQGTAELMAMIREGLQRKRDIKAESKMASQPDYSALINQSRAQVLNMCSDENAQQSLTAYLK